MSVFPRIVFVLSRFRVFLSDGSSKALQKTFCKKNRVENLLHKNLKPFFGDPRGWVGGPEQNNSSWVG
jgi:hypothetical protein